MLRPGAAAWRQECLTKLRARMALGPAPIPRAPFPRGGKGRSSERGFARARCARANPLICGRRRRDRAARSAPTQGLGRGRAEPTSRLPPLFAASFLTRHRAAPTLGCSQRQGNEAMRHGRHGPASSSPVPGSTSADGAHSWPSGRFVGSVTGCGQSLGFVLTDARAGRIIGPILREEQT